MKKEWTLEQIKDFVKKDYQSVSARMVKCLLFHYNDLKETHDGLKADLDYCKNSAQEALERGSIGFVDWIERNEWHCQGVIDDERLWSTDYLDSPIIPTEQLYKEYIKSLEK